jgi:hypothetical protein
MYFLKSKKVHKQCYCVHCKVHFALFLFKKVINLYLFSSTFSFQIGQ